MTKYVLSFCLLFTTVLCYAQQTKTTYNEIKNSFVEKFEVLKSDKNIKQGAYELTSKYSGAVITTGFYKNNMKDSVWREYDYKKNKIVEGAYKDGNRIGEWINYNEKGSVISRYNYTTQNLLYYKGPKSDSSALYKVIVGPVAVQTKLERVPILITGTNTMWRDVGQSIRYPAKARENNISGKVIITFKIDERGKTSDYKIAQRIGYGCDEEALQVVENACNNDWVPGIYNGKIVPVIYTLPVSFILSSN